MKQFRKAGATSVILEVFVADSSSTTGGGLTGLAYNSAGLTAYYHRDVGTTATAITLATMTVGTFTSGGFKEIDATNMPGWYQFCPPDAALAAGAKSVSFHLKGATNMAPLPIEVQLVAFDPQDTVRLGLTAMPNVASGSAGALITSGTGTAQLSVSGGRAASDVTYFGGAAGTFASGIPSVNAAQISGDSVAADNLENAFDDTAGPVPWLGIVDQGTAQSTDGSSTVIRAAASFGDNALVGSTLFMLGSTQGYWQSAQIHASTGATDTVTHSAFAVTPTGTLTYKIVGTPPGNSSLPTPADLVQISGDATAANNAESFFDGTGYAGTNNVIPSVTTVTGNVNGSVASVTGAVGSVTGNVGGNVAGTIGGLTAGALADLFDTDSGTTYASAVAGSVVKEIADNAGGSALTEAGIADAVWDEARAGHVASGSFGEGVASVVGNVGGNVTGSVGSLATQAKADVNAEVDQAITDAALATAADLATTDGKVDTITTNIGTPIDTDIATDIANLQADATTLLAGDAIYKKGVAVTAFGFYMEDTNGDPGTSLTVTVQISKDGGAFNTVGGSVTEISDGFYEVDLSGTEMNADEILFKATAPGAAQRNLKIRTQS